MYRFDAHRKACAPCSENVPGPVPTKASTLRLAQHHMIDFLKMNDVPSSLNMATCARASVGKIVQITYIKTAVTMEMLVLTLSNGKSIPRSLSTKVQSSCLDVAISSRLNLLMDYLACTKYTPEVKKENSTAFEMSLLLLPVPYPLVQTELCIKSIEQFF
jgi:hypothetical protein